jgi:hypothetical protein
VTIAYTPRTWADAELADLGAPVTPANEQFFVDWAAAEGGAGPQWGIANNSTSYNPINISLTSGPQGYGYDPGTGKFWPGASPTPGNSPPIAAFSDWTTGLEATAARLEEPFASSILSGLRSGTATEDQLAAAVGSSGWGTGAFGVRGAPGTASGSGPQGTATATLTGANAQQATLNANPFDLFGIPQTFLGGAASAIWADVGPFLAKSFLVIGGLTLVVLGLYKAADIGPKVKQSAQEAAPLAAAAAA